MNIFAIHDDPILAARDQHDRHVNKMTVESAQLLSAACHETPRFFALIEPHHKPLLYKMSHKNNPLTNWTKASDANFVWLAIHAAALVAEKHRRFPTNGMHSSYPLIVALGVAAAKLVGVDRFWTRDDSRTLVIDPAIVAFAANHTPFYQAMPDQYKRPDSISAYRSFYTAEKIFQDHVKWTNCESLPAFLVQYAESASDGDPYAPRIFNLMSAHRDGLVAARMPRDPHPDLLKPTNPSAIKRFGVRV